MGAPALAERVGGLVRRAVDVLPFPKRTDLSTLPFDQRWARAEKLPDFQKAQFLRKELVRVIDSVDSQPNDYNTGAKHLRLDINPDQIGRSVLPTQIIDTLPLKNEGGILLSLNVDCRNVPKDPNRTYGSIFLGYQGAKSGIGVTAEYYVNSKRRYGELREKALPIGGWV